MNEDTKYLIDVNKDNLDRVIGFVGVIDSKANFILSVVLALTAYLVTQLGSYLDAHAKWGNGHAWAPACFVLLDLVAIACFGCFITTAVTVICAIIPRTNRHSGRNSPLLFGTIANMPIEDFKTTVKTITPSELIDQLADQTFDNAKIVVQKTTYVVQSIKYFWWGMTCFFIFSILRPILVILAA